MYAKIIDNEVQFAKRIVEYEGETIYNPSEEIILALGFLPVVFTEQPESTITTEYVPTWSEVDGEIVQGWEAVEKPVSYEEIAKTLLGGAV